MGNILSTSLQRNDSDHKKEVVSKRANPTRASLACIENAMSKHKEFSSRNKLYQALEKPLRYPTFQSCLDYLEQSNKIMFDANSIVWIFDYLNEKRKLENKELLKNVRIYNKKQLIKEKEVRHMVQREPEFTNIICERFDKSFPDAVEDSEKEKK